MRLPRSLWIALTVVIAGAWLVNLVVGWFDLGQTEPAVNFIFGGVVGSLYMIRPKSSDGARSIVDALRGGNDEQPPRGDAP